MLVVGTSNLVMVDDMKLVVTFAYLKVAVLFHVFLLSFVPFPVKTSQLWKYCCANVHCCKYLFFGCIHVHLSLAHVLDTYIFNPLNSSDTEHFSLS